MVGPARLWDKVDASGDCWEWTASTDKDGYGWFAYEGRNQRAHRVVWSVLVGSIPRGYTIDHLCRNTGCVNPDHLEPVTMRRNLLRADAAPTTKNAKKTHCVNGHRLVGDNLRPNDPNGWRRCRVCDKQRNRAWYYAQKASS